MVGGRLRRGRVCTVKAKARATNSIFYFLNPQPKFSDFNK